MMGVFIKPLQIASIIIVIYFQINHSIAGVSDNDAETSAVSNPYITVNGIRYCIDSVKYLHDKLILSCNARPGKFADMDLDIRLDGLQPGSVSKKYFSLNKNHREFPALYIRWKTRNSDYPESENIDHGFNGDIKFGLEKNFKAPVDIRLNSTGKVKIQLQGRFIATRSDIIIKNGEVDSRHADIKTAEYFAMEFLKKSYNLKQLIGYKTTYTSISKYGVPDKKSSKDNQFANARIDSKFINFKNKFIIIINNL